jgi:hypothetical protein
MPQRRHTVERNITQVERTIIGFIDGIQRLMFRSLDANDEELPTLAREFHTALAEQRANYTYLQSLVDKDEREKKAPEKPIPGEMTWERAEKMVSGFASELIDFREYDPKQPDERNTKLPE